MSEHSDTRYRTYDASRKATGVKVRIIGLPGERLGAAANLLARCFHANPNFVDLRPREEARFGALCGMFAAGSRDALAFGNVYTATRGIGSSVENELIGVAVWPPRHTKGTAQPEGGQRR